MRGKFITFEGGEGTGKSTQAQRLAERLKVLGIAVTQTREPGGSPGAEVIRHVILSGAAKPLGAEAEAMLFAAAREDHIAHTIKPALDRGHWVICDRFADSTRVYQGVLDAPAETGLARAHARRGNGAIDRFESEDIAFHERLREAYRQLAIAEPERCVLIDASETPERVTERVWSVVNRRLDPATAPLAIEEIGS
jgi:dTMP kinase